MPVLWPVFTKAQAKIPKVQIGTGLILLPVLIVESVSKFVRWKEQLFLKKDLTYKILPPNIGSDSFSERLDVACATRTPHQAFQKNCPEYCPKDLELNKTPIV